LLGEGLMPAAVADRLGVGERYLKRLLADTDDSGSRPSVSRPANPHPDRAEVALTGSGKVAGHPGGSEAPTAGFASFAELDRWLDSRP
jgi:hypothetical protein